MTRRPHVESTGLYRCHCGAEIDGVTSLGATCRAGHYSSIDQVLAANLHGARLLRLSQVKPSRVGWLWTGRIPLGKITILDGDPGLGKSTVTLDWIARVTTHRPMPEEAEPSLTGPYGAILLSAEDGLSDTIRPRLDAAGADPDRVTAFVSVFDPAHGDRLPTLTDLAQLGAAIDEADAAIVVADPLMAYLPVGVDAYNDQQVRTALTPLARLAEERDIAIVLVRHLKKSHAGNAVYAGGGAIGLIGAARSGLLIAPDPSDRERRILALAKKNLTGDVASLAYRLAPDADGRVRVAWDGESSYSAEELLDDGARANGSSQADAAFAWLLKLLSDGPLPSAEVDEEARARGFSDKVVRVARRRLGVTARREAGNGRGSGRWLLCLPDESDAQLSLLSVAEHPGDQGALLSKQGALIGEPITGAIRGRADQEGETLADQGALTDQGALGGRLESSGRASHELHGGGR